MLNPASPSSLLSITTTTRHSGEVVAKTGFAKSHPGSHRRGRRMQPMGHLEACIESRIARLPCRVASPPCLLRLGGVSLQATGHSSTALPPGGVHHSSKAQGQIRSRRAENSTPHIRGRRDTVHMRSGSRERGRQRRQAATMGRGEAGNTKAVHRTADIHTSITQVEATADRRSVRSLTNASWPTVFTSSSSQKLKCLGSTGAV